MKYYPDKEMSNREFQELCELAADRCDLHFKNMYAEFKDMEHKVKWQRIGEDYISIEISDWYQDMPTSMLYKIMQGMFLGIKGDEGASEFRKSIVDECIEWSESKRRYIH